MSAAEVDYRVKGVLSLVGLADRAFDYPLSLSGGEQQRVAIARSIIGKPILLLADEPTGNLDSQTAREIMSLFREIHEMGTTVLIATHDEQLMSEYPARVIELRGGQVSADRAELPLAEEGFEDPRPRFR
jgi:cell division transport system ATP-binding protein